MIVILLMVAAFLAGIGFERWDRRWRARWEDRARQAELMLAFRRTETSATPRLWRQADGHRELPREAADADHWAAVRDELARTAPVPVHPMAS